MITKDILIEDLLNQLPEAVSYLMQEGIKCMACGDPIWGTLEQAANSKGFAQEDLDRFLRELNELNKKS